MNRDINYRFRNSVQIISILGSKLAGVVGGIEDKLLTEETIKGKGDGRVCQEFEHN